MLQRDYLMRLVQQATEAMARAAGLRTEGKGLEARRTLDGALVDLLERHATLFAHLDAATAARMLADPDRVRMAAKIVAAQAELALEQDDTFASHALRARAVALYQHARLSGARPDEALDALVQSNPQPEG